VRRMLLLATAGLALILLRQDCAQAAPIAVGTRSCLFLDDRFIAGQTGLKRTWHQGQPRPEPAIAATEPWEKWPHLFGSVLFDPVARRYKMWYEDIPDRGGAFYAESADGKTWTKPRLGLFEIKGSRDNNCVLTPCELPNVFLDPNETDPQARFKMLAWGGPFEHHGRKLSGLVLFRSGDGIHWKIVGPFPLPEPTDDTAQARTVRDTNQVIWDPLGQQYLGTFRTFPRHPGLPGWFRDEKYRLTPGLGGHRRGVGVSTSKELSRGWSPITTVLKADARDDAKAARLSRTPALDWVEPYVMPVFPYGNHYLGVVGMLFQIDAGAENMSKSVPDHKRPDTQEGGGDLQLTFSHDGRTWHRQPDRQTLIAPSTAGLVPCYAACNPPLELGDELWMYYTEAQSAHPATGHKALIRAAVWRRDGFVSLAAAGAGRLTTPALLVGGSRLIVNYRTADGGALRVALVDADGHAIDGYRAEDCLLKPGNHLAAAVEWKKHADLAGFRGRAVRIQFELEKAQLWSFRFAP